MIDERQSTPQMSCSHAVTTYSYEARGNPIGVTEPSGLTTMAYDFENRLKTYQNGSSITTYAYSANGLKRTELVNGSLTSLIWDGQDYLGEA